MLLLIFYVLIGPIYVPDDFCCQDRPKGVHFSLDNKISGATFAGQNINEKLSFTEIFCSFAKAVELRRKYIEI